MEWVRFMLMILLPGAAGLAFLLLRWRPGGARKRSPDPKLLETNQNRTRKPLEILYPGHSDGNKDGIEVDIVAVHGLGSNVDWSWTWKDGESRVNWLGDHNMLPAKVPKSRIMVYNYESRWHADAPKTRLQLCGEEFVHSIHSFRRDAPDRPIVFVGHSLGGNVLIDALLYANDDDRYDYIPKATVGLVFLGTPFRGTQWKTLLDSMAQLNGLAGSHRGITKELDFDEPVLLDKLHRFCRLRNRLSTPVSCFSELYETDYGRRVGLSGVIKGMIVKEESAYIPGLDRYALQTDHLKINKYRGPDDRAFIMVSDVISKMCGDANNVVRRRQHPKDIITNRDHVLRQNPNAGGCLRGLFLTDPLDDKKDLKRKKGDRAGGTCDWILGTEELTAWLGPSQTRRSEEPTAQVLWLHGNPGTGKSTMAIFLTDELSSAFSATEGKTLAYFFCDSAFDKRNTATSIVRGLLLQLIQQHPQLLAYLLPKYTERGQELFNSFDALWTILLDAAADANTGQKYCIIDALDECDRESQNTLLRQLQSSFQGQNAPPNIQILITSRPYDEIHEYMQVFANKDLASFPEAKQDVNRCINEKVGSLAKKKHYTAKLEDNIINVLRKKAEGTFLWVGLACEELEDIPGKDTLKALQDMPKGLHSLYKKLLDRAIGQKYGASEVRKILSSIIACLRPLSLLELSAACKLHEDEDEETRAQFMREQVASCRLMVIVQDEEVLLLHQSVRDFLVGVGADHLIDELEAHAHLAYRCVDLLIQHSNAEQQQRPFHLLEYATTEWTQHARLAHSEFKVMPSQREFFEIESQCREHWLRSYRRTRYIPGNFSILHVAAHWGIQALVEYVFSTIDDKHSHLVNCVDESGATPLKRAVWYGHPSVLSKLLDFGGCATTRALQAAVGHPKDGKVLTAMLLNKRRNEITITEEVLTAAAGNYGNGKEAMAVLLDLRGDEITITGDVVWAAAENEKNGREIIALLLDSRGTKITITEEAVIVIAKNFHKKVIALLLDRRGDEITITEDVVKVAAKFGQDGILDLLAMNSSISVLD